MKNDYKFTLSDDMHIADADRHGLKIEQITRDIVSARGRDCLLTESDVEERRRYLIEHPLQPTTVLWAPSPSQRPAILNYILGHNAL